MSLYDWARLAYGIYQDNRSPRFDNVPLSPEQKQYHDLWLKSMTNPALQDNAANVNRMAGQVLDGYKNLSWTSPKTFSGDVGYGGSRTPYSSPPPAPQGPPPKGPLAGRVDEWPHIPADDRIGNPSVPGDYSHVGGYFANNSPFNSDGPLTQMTAQHPTPAMDLTNLVNSVNAAAKKYGPEAAAQMFGIPVAAILRGVSFLANFLRSRNGTLPQGRSVADITQSAPGTMTPAASSPSGAVSTGFTGMGDYRPAYEGGIPFEPIGGTNQPSWDWLDQRNRQIIDSFNTGLQNHRVPIGIGGMSATYQGTPNGSGERGRGMR